MTRSLGGSTFAEDPQVPAPEATIIWNAAFDPGTLRVAAMPAGASDLDHLEPSWLERWLTLVAGADGREHAVLSDGWHHIRLDIEAGSLATRHPVLLRFELTGLAGAEAKLLPLRRFLALCRGRRFAATLFPHDVRIDRWLTLLWVHDALLAGASQREIAGMLVSKEQLARDWAHPSESLRSRVRRLVHDARAMAAGGYRSLLQRRPKR